MDFCLLRKRIITRREHFMNISKFAHTLDLHIAGWPIRLITNAGVGHTANEMLFTEAQRLWTEAHSVVRWLQREPRGHAAMRIGIVIPPTQALSTGSVTGAAKL